MGPIMADTPKRKPFAVPEDPRAVPSKLQWRDIGRWSCAKQFGVGYGQSEPALAPSILSSKRTFVCVAANVPQAIFS
jgi:hypothetical protein